MGADTAQLVINAVQDVLERHQPKLLVVGESCTAELLQDQPGTLANHMGVQTPVVPLELPAYSRKENWGASETLYQIVRACLKNQTPPADGDRIAHSVNLIGPASLCFRARDNVLEVTRLLQDMGVQVNVIAPLGASPEDVKRIPHATANICLYPEIGALACRWLEKKFAQPTITTVPIGVGATQDFIREVTDTLQLQVNADLPTSRLPWYSRSIDSTYLTGKRVFVFGDATHVQTAVRIAADEFAFEVVGVGTYQREHARQIRQLAAHYQLTPLITDDYLAVESAIVESAPELVLGTQMERHIAKRLGIPCALISAPFHVQDCPARYSPVMGFEGANVIFDTWVHPLMMGLEEHLLGMFREDFEFAEGAGPSHLGKASARETSPVEEPAPTTSDEAPALEWAGDALAELKRIPFFVRKKAMRNTEQFAIANGLYLIDVDTLYDAKAHYS